MNATFNWFPGHMNKTLKNIEAKRPVIDLVIELVDARAPIATQNLTFQKILMNKPRLLLMTKTDLADPKVTESWLNYFKNQSQVVMILNYEQPNFVKKLINAIQATMAEKQARQKKRGLVNPQINALVVGIPNVGKSTFINHLSKDKKVKVGNQPGVTRGLQVLQLTPQINLIDSPGVLPAKLGSSMQADILAGLNAIRQDIFPLEEVSEALFPIIVENYPEFLPPEIIHQDPEFAFVAWANLKNQTPHTIMKKFLKNIADGVWPVSLEFPSGEPHA